MPISAALGSSALLPAGLGFRNVIINGDFRINQRGFTTTQTSGAYGFDRWAQYVSDGTVTYTPQTFTVGNAISGYEPTNYAQIVTTGQTLASARASLWQAIEGVRTFAGQTVTVSFWAKAISGTPKVAVTWQQAFGTSGSSAVDTFFGQVTISTSWTRYTITGQVPSISGKTIGTANDALWLGFYFSAGANYNTQTGTLGIQSNTFQIWGVQAEQNYQPTPFEQRPIGVELQLCQRYYEHNYGTGYAVGSASAYPYNQPHTGINGYTVANQQKFLYSLYMVPKRRVPDITIYDTAGNNGKLTTLDAGGTGTTNVTVGISSTTDKMIGYAPSAGTYAGYAYFYVASAEL